MTLTESIKRFFNTEPPAMPSSKVIKKNVVMDLTDYSGENTYNGSFFDDDDDDRFESVLIGSEQSRLDLVLKQRHKILQYRQLAITPDVTEAIDEIVNEVIFSHNHEMPIKVRINEENEKLSDAITAKFEKITHLMKLKKNLYSIVRNSYIDGQLVLHTAYKEDSTVDGIQSIKMVEPCLLYYDKDSKSYKYAREDRFKALEGHLNTEYSPEELCRVDFGMHSERLTLSYLEFAIKPANMLKTLEDLLIPMRFSRSISRRVFNVDIGDLPAKRGAEVMREHQSKFKYKKFYNNQTGEVSNQQHITSMVEDYWFANRSGGKGTTVDTLDETGNLGEIDDILYFSKKLYRALKIPTNRINIDTDSNKDFSFDDTTVSKEDLKFFMFISRLRIVYSEIMMELLKREVISTKTMTEDEWLEKEGDIEVYFTNDNTFIDNMNNYLFSQKLDVYSTAQEYAGKLFSVDTIMKQVFKMNETEITDELKKIKKESKDELFSNFYEDSDF